MRPKPFLFAGIILAVFLSGCFSVPSSPSPKFYTLQAFGNLEPKRLAGDARLIVGIGPVEIPQYQNRPQIVTQNKEGMLTFAQFERWGEPLDSAIARLMLNNLTLLIPQADFQISPFNFSISLDYQVLINIVQLESRLDHDVSLAAQWTIVDGKSKTMLLTKRFTANEPVEGGNYLGLARALGKIITRLSDEISVDLANNTFKTEVKDVVKQ